MADDQLAYEPPDPERPASSAPTERELTRESPAVPALDYSPAPQKHDAYAALRVPAYRLFSVGWMVAVIGNQATLTALGWEVFERIKASSGATAAKMALGGLAGLQVIPLILLALPAGVIADRFDRRRIISITAALSSACTIMLAVLSYRPGSVWTMVYVMTLNSAVLTIGRPSRSALLPRLVPAGVLSNAVTWNSSLFQVSAMLGPAIGGLMIAPSMRVFGSLAMPYLFDACCAGFYATVLFFIARPAAPIHHPGTDAPLRLLSAGISFVWRTKIILATLTLDLFAVLLGGAVYLLPVFAQDILKVDAVRFGWLRAGEAIGAFTMAIIIAHLPPMKKAGRAMLIAVVMFGACTIVFGLSRSFWLSFAMLVLIGAFDNISVVVRHTLVQVLTPDHMRGRVSAVNNIFIGASNELGGLESGLTAAAFTTMAVWMGYAHEHASTIGTTVSVVVGGVGTIIVVVVTAMIFPELRKFGRLQAPEEAEMERGVEVAATQKGE